MWGAASCVPGSLVSKNTLCFTRAQKKSVVLLKVSSHFAKSLHSPFSESQSEGGGQTLWAAENPKSIPGHLIPVVGVGLEFAVVTPLVRSHQRKGNRMGSSVG